MKDTDPVWSLVGSSLLHTGPYGCECCTFSVALFLWVRAPGGVPRGCARNAHDGLSGWEHGLDSHRGEQGEDLRPESRRACLSWIQSPRNLEIRANHMTACPADSHFSFNLEGETKGNFLTLMPKSFQLLFIAVWFKAHFRTEPTVSLPFTLLLD